MSLLVDIKDSVDVPTGALWFGMSIALVFYLELIKFSLLAASGSLEAQLLNLNVLIQLITPSLVLLSLAFASIIYYLLYILKLVLIFPVKDKNFNRYLKKKKNQRLMSFDYSLIKQVANKFENKLLLVLGSALLCVYVLWVGYVSPLLFVPIAILLFQVISLLDYYKSPEFNALSDLRLYYALARDEDSSETAKELQQAVYAKDWNYLATIVRSKIERMKRSNVKMIKKIPENIQAFKNHYADKNNEVTSASIWQNRSSVHQLKFAINLEILIKQGFQYFFYDHWILYQKLDESAKVVNSMTGDLVRTSGSISYPFKPDSFEYIRQTYPDLNIDVDQKKIIDSAINMVEEIKKNCDEIDKIVNELVALKSEPV